MKKVHEIRETVQETVQEMKETVQETVQEGLESQAGQQIVEKSKKGIFHAIFGRTGIIILLILLQLGCLFLLFGKLRDYAIFAYGTFTVLTVVTVIIIINCSSNPAFKLAWMVPITLAPVFGVLLYIFVESQVGSRILNMRLTDLNRKMKNYLLMDSHTIDKVKEENRQIGNMAHYVESKAGYPVYENGQVEYFPLGEDKFARLIEELEKAEKFIFMEYFIVAEGRMWDTVHEILTRKAQEGVEVRFMYDGTCTVTLLPYNYAKKLQEEGIQCKVFSPIKPTMSTTQNNRDHRKIVVIDGHTAFTGGINLADEYINEKERFGHWKDTAVMIKGEAVKSFTSMFLQMWNIDEKNAKYLKYINCSIPELPNKQDGYVLPYADSPLDKELVGELVYMDILNTAKDYVHIMTPYLILDHEMITTLTYAAKRGIDVKIIMPGIPDKKYAYALAKTYYPELIRAGVKIYHYEPGFIHAKQFMSDDEKAVVGTINLDYRSLYLHFECAVFMYRVPEIMKMEEDFQETLKQCREITMEEYKKEKWYTKLFGSMLRLIAPLM